jgi:hypothetical protein
MADYLKLPPIPPFDASAAALKIEQRNAIRANNHLPLLDAERGIARLREHYESSSRSDRFYSLTSDCIGEIYGQITPGDFRSLSSLRWFMASKQNLIRDLIQN